MEEVEAKAGIFLESAVRYRNICRCEKAFTNVASPLWATRICRSSGAGIHLERLLYKYVTATRLGQAFTLEFLGWKHC